MAYKHGAVISCARCVVCCLVHYCGQCSIAINSSEGSREQARNSSCCVLLWVMPHDHSSHGMVSKTSQLLSAVLHCKTSISACELNWPAALNLCRSIWLRVYAVRSKVDKYIVGMNACGACLALISSEHDDCVVSH